MPKLVFCKGKVTVLAPDKDEASTFYKLEPEISVPKGARVIITGSPLGGSDIIQTVTTLDQKKILYTYGEAWADTMIQGRLLMGTSDTINKSIGALQEWFDKNRVVVSKKPVKLSVGSKAHSIYVTGMQVGNPNPEFHYHDFTIRGKLYEE